MTREQADRIIAVISQDATGRGAFFPTEDTECVLGGLWLAMGKPRTNYINSYRMRKFYGLQCYGKNGVDYDEWTALHLTNDLYDDVYERRIALIELVESWVK